MNYSLEDVETNCARKLGGPVKLSYSQYLIVRVEKDNAAQGFIHRPWSKAECIKERRSLAVQWHLNLGGVGDCQA